LLVLAGKHGYRNYRESFWHKTFRRGAAELSAARCAQGLVHAPRPNIHAPQLGGYLMLVHILTCESHLWFAVPCMRSLLTFCQDPIRLVIHDDGTLTQASVELLTTAFPDSILIPRRSADAEMADALAHFPHMAEARIQLPVLLKLIDVSLTHGESALVRYVDTDVLFQRRFRGLFPVSDPPTSGAFLMDSRNSYAAHPLDIWPLGPLRLPRHLNAGLFWIRRDRVDHERMEYLFKRWGPRRIRKYQDWFEQTVWADQAWRAHCSMFDPAQIRTATLADGPRSQLTGIHFVTPTRAMLKAALQSASAAPSASVNTSPGDIEEIRLCPSKPYGLCAAVFVAVRALAAKAGQRIAQYSNR
jgi:hypothetical protein